MNIKFNVAPSSPFSRFQGLPTQGPQQAYPEGQGQGQGQGQSRGDVPLNYVPPSRALTGGRPFDDTDPASPEGRFLAAYRAMNPVIPLNPFRRPDPNLTNALASLFGGGVSAGIGADATLALPGAQATAENQFEDAELARRSSRMGQDFDQQQRLDDYSDQVLQRRQGAGDRIRQLLERLQQQQGGGQLQERIGGSVSPLLQALGLGTGIQ